MTSNIETIVFFMQPRMLLKDFVVHIYGSVSFTPLSLKILQIQVSFQYFIAYMYALDQRKCVL